MAFAIAKERPSVIIFGGLAEEGRKTIQRMFKSISNLKNA